MSRLFLFLTIFCLAETASAKSINSSILKNSTVLASTIPIDKLRYTETVDCGSVAQADIFRRARLYLLQSAPEDKLLLNDKDTGDLVSGGNLSVMLPRTESFAGGIYTVQYVLTIECVNRKYRASISRIEVLQISMMKSTPLELFKLQSEKDTKQLQSEIEAKLKARLEDLKISVTEFKPF